MVLKQLLQNPRILKVGLSVAGDLKYLQDACASALPFVGAVDLARFAKDRLVISSAKIGLADLCAKVLGKRVNKNVAERISSAWDREQLSKSQIRYAVLDVYACHVYMINSHPSQSLQNSRASWPSEHRSCSLTMTGLV